MATRRWVKVPGPGEFRGEGEWQEHVPGLGRWDWDALLETGYLPIYEGDDEPDDEKARAWREATIEASRSPTDPSEGA